ncbi:ESCRT-I component [Sphaerosporella brunnea]|uniref:ESCRT-I component n=1 Tax=Sphaerosporella brunnea TaxID=1250544 RepID=A0A5J5F904_9PEZI|nr:ESCRT-I component [Sphaerosporella brunnea]
MTTPRPIGGPPPQVLQWLHRVIAPEYQEPQRTYTDVATTLATYPTLSPRTSVYTYENGKSELMVHLFGTLPVMFRGATYNIPMSIWVPHTYPRQSPIAFVTPAKDMVIRPGNHVDLAGKCYHPYLANWPQHWERSNIVDLCEVLRGVFGREPPVMAKQPTLPPQQQPVTPPPRPPLPPELAPKSPPPAASPPGPHGPPPVPPLPKELTGERNGPASGESRRHSIAQPLPPHPYQGQPPLPPALRAYGVTGIHAHPTPPGPTPLPYRAAPPPPGSPQVQGRPPIQPPTQFPHPQPQSSYHPHLPPPPPQQSPPLPPKPHQQQQQPHFPPPRPPSYQGYPPSPYTAPPQPLVASLAPPLKPIAPIDLMDSPSPPLATSQAGSPAPAPPPPPNPEKDLLISRIADQLHSLAQENHTQTASALSGAVAQRVALHAATANLEREQHELRRIAAVCDTDAEILRERIAMADRVIHDCRTRELPDVDSMVVAGSVVETQLYDLVAEDMAIEDTIYVLGKALDRERIGLDVFLKVRTVVGALEGF